MPTNSKRSAVEARILYFLDSEKNKGLGFNEISSKLNRRKRASGYIDSVSRPTISACLKQLQEKRRIQRDVETRKYKITAEGNTYLKRSEIVDFILSSTALDSLFEFDYGRKKEDDHKEISAAYMMATTSTDRKHSPHSLALLHERLRRTQPMIWEIDIFNYAIKAGMLNDKTVGDFRKAIEGRASIQELETLQKKLRVIWKRLFKGVERLTVVETVRPRLLLEKLEKEIRANHYFRSD